MRLFIAAALAASLLSLSISDTAYSAESRKPNTDPATRYQSFKPAPPPTALFETTAKVALHYASLHPDIIRQKNIKEVTNPHPGIYCIYTVSSVKPDPANTYPTVTVDWSWSSGNALLAYYAEARNDCGSGTNIVHTFEVETYDFSSGTPTLSNDVAFYMTID